MSFSLANLWGGHAAAPAPDDLGIPSTPQGGWREVAVGDAAPHLSKVRLVDVREPHEFAGGHIDGAELVPLGTVVQAAAEWDRAQPILLICRSGNRSGRAAAELQRLGFQKLYNLTGGMMAWTGSGLPIR